jgi:hypothetical protein
MGGISAVRGIAEKMGKKSSRAQAQRAKLITPSSVDAPRHSAFWKKFQLLAWGSL